MSQCFFCKRKALRFCGTCQYFICGCEDCPGSPCPISHVPFEIQEEVVDQQTAMGWPDLVPANAEMPNGRWKRYANLNVGDCEQLVEFLARKARKSIATWCRTRTTRARRAAGRSILYARLYRCRYIELTGQENTTEADMPLPFSWEE